MKAGARSQETGVRRPGCLRCGVDAASRLTHHESRLTAQAFSLIELLVVIAIMGLLAALAMPAFNKLKPNVMAAATQKLLADVGRARQLAISQHTTVYMVFVPSGFWTDPSYNPPTWTPANLNQGQKLADKQFVGYNFVSLRSIGDQPGRNTVRYLDSWRTLPEGTFIAPQKFSNTVFTVTETLSSSTVNLVITNFDFTYSIPFPSETAPPAANGHWVTMPYIAFNYLGQLVDANGLSKGQNALIPLSQGSVNIARDNTKTPTLLGPAVPAATAVETPPGNTTNAFNIINIDWLTGRARVERQEVL